MLNYKKIAVIAGAVGISLSAYALSPSDSLTTWVNSPESEQAALCEVMATKFNQPGLSASSLCSCISEKAGDPGSVMLTVSEAATSCSI